MSRLASTCLLALSLAWLSACATSTVKYDVKPTNPESPPDGGFAFALSTSSITLAPLSSDKSAQPSDVCKGTHWNASAGLASCVRKLKAVVTPESDRDAIYVVVPDSSWYQTETLTPSFASSDPLLLTSVQVNTKSNIPALLGAVGAGAAAGFAWGPVGGAIGGVVGAATGLGSEHLFSARAGKAEWYTRVCDYEKHAAQYATLRANVAAALYLPVSIDYIAPEVEPGLCWHPLPTPDTGGLTESTDTQGATGWFYRFITYSPANEDPPSQYPPVIYNPNQAGTGSDLSIVLTDDSGGDTGFFHVNKGATITGSVTAFPISACREVTLQITWWTALKKVAASTNDPQTYQVQIEVADPQFVQNVALPKSGTVTLLSPCGGDESPGAPSTDLADSINALIAQVQAVKSAETTWKGGKGQSGTN